MQVASRSQVIRMRGERNVIIVYVCRHERKFSSQDETHLEMEIIFVIRH